MLVQTKVLVARVVTVMDFKDYYNVLGVGRGASQDDIKAAYRKLARKWHPDVNAGDAAAEQHFKEINEAHEVLGNPDTRRKYDALGADWRRIEQTQAAGGNPFGGGPFGFGGFPGGFRTARGDSGFSDFFEQFFGAAHGARPAPRRTRGRDVEHTLELSLEHAYHGATRRLSIDRGGRRRSVDVRIPAGVTDGACVRVAGEGEPGAAGAPAGNLLLRIRIAPHPRFTLRGRDLHLTVTVPVTTAVLGGEVDVTTIDGAAVRLKVPAGTQPGQALRLRGRGMPGAGGKPGDLLAAVQITVPRQLSPAAREHYEALAALAEKSPGAARGNEP